MLTEKQMVKIRKAFNGVGQRAVFKMLSDTNRYRIFEMLMTNPQLTVTEIAKILKISTPLASQHLKVLENGDILDKTKNGKQVFYKLKPNTIAQSIMEKIKIN